MALIVCILNSYDDNPQTASVQITAEMATALLNKDLKKLRKILEAFFPGYLILHIKKGIDLPDHFF